MHRASLQKQRLRLRTAVPNPTKKPSVVPSWDERRGGASLLLEDPCFIRTPRRNASSMTRRKSKRNQNRARYRTTSQVESEREESGEFCGNDHFVDGKEVKTYVVLAVVVVFKLVRSHATRLHVNCINVSQQEGLGSLLCSLTMVSSTNNRWCMWRSLRQLD